MKKKHMTTHTYSIPLTKEQEKIAQLLTRDAWVYFSSMITTRDLFHVKEIPMMPRGRLLEITNDAEILQYYADYAHVYSDELRLLGWTTEQSNEAADGFVAALEHATGIQRGFKAAQFGS